MSIDLAFDDAQQAIVDAVQQFCRERCPDSLVKEKETSGVLPQDLWCELADLGVLALATPEGEGGAMEMLAALESLGAAVFPGPLPATFLATQLLPDTERAAVARGEAIVSVGTPPLMPFAPAAQVFVELATGVEAQAWLARPRGQVEPVATLGGEPWGHIELERVSDLGPALAGLVLYDIAAAGYLAAAARRLVEATAEHARTRKQFGRAIGEFQAVAHPLADCAMQVDAASTLARAAAFGFDGAAGDPAAAARCAAAARLSAARAALRTAHVAHQLFGAIGITLEGDVFHVSRRIRQLVSQAPGEAAARACLLRGLDL